MTRRARIWWLAGGTFIAINFAGGIIALAGGEVTHAAGHAALFVVSLAVAARVAGWSGKRRARRDEAEVEGSVPEFTSRLQHLEESLDVAAIEIERIGEGRRFMTDHFTHSKRPGGAGYGAAQPMEVRPAPDSPKQ